MFRVCRYRRHMMSRTAGTFIRLKSSTEHYSFFSQLSVANKTGDPESINHLLSDCENMDQLIATSYRDFMNMENRNMLEPSMLLRQRATLPSCNYVTLLDAAVRGKSLSLLNRLIGQTHNSPLGASYIGLMNLFGLYMPFLQNKTGESVNGSERNLVLTAMSRHLSYWFYHLSPVHRRTQIETFIYLSRICLTDSPTDIRNLHEELVSSLTAIGRERENDTSTLSLPPDNAHPASSHSSNSITGGDNCESSLGNSAASVDMNQDDDEELSNRSLQSLFILAACRQLHSAGHVDDAADFLRSFVSSGVLSAGNVDYAQYSALVRQAAPSFSEFYDDNGNDITTTVAPSGTLSVGGGNALLDALFRVHSSGSSPADALLRSVFYKSLLDCERPTSVLHYESLRQQADLNLSRRGHNYVLQAYAAILDARGMFTHLRQWAEQARPLGAISSQAPSGYCEKRDATSSSMREYAASNTTWQCPEQCPDIRAYACVIDFFQKNKQMMAAPFLEELFEHMQDDQIEPSGSQLVELFAFTNSLRLPDLSNKMLMWFCNGLGNGTGITGLRSEEVLGSQQPRMNINTSGKTFGYSSRVLAQLYSSCLETNAHARRGITCLQLVLEMRRRAISVPKHLFSAVMLSLRSTKEHLAIIALFESMPDFGVKRDQTHVSMVIVAYVRTNQLLKAVHMIKRFEKAGLALEGEAYIAVAFELLRLLGDVRFKTLSDTDRSGIESNSDSVNTFSARMKRVCGDAMMKKDVIVECAHCFQKAVAAHALYPSTKKYLHSLIFKLDERTFLSLDGAILSYCSPPASVGTMNEITTASTTANTVNSASSHAPAARRFGPPMAYATSGAMVANKRVDGLSLLIREMRYARWRFRTAPPFWGRAHVKGPVGTAHSQNIIRGDRVVNSSMEKDRKQG